MSNVDGHTPEITSNESSNSTSSSEDKFDGTGLYKTLPDDQNRKIFDLKSYEKIAYPLLFVFIIYGVVLSHTNLPYYNDWYVKEDGLIEWMTVVALLFGSFVAVWRSFILGPFRPVIFRLCLLFLAGVFFFGAGEEISWGQRMFGWKSPEYFAFNNSQGETNLHNLVIQGIKINKLFFGLLLGIAIGLYFIVLPLLYRRVQKIKTIIDSMAIPVPRVFHLLAYLSLFLLTEVIAGHKKGEILEFGGCWIFVFMFMDPFNRSIYSRITQNR